MADLVIQTTQSADLDVKSIAAYISIELAAPKAAEKWLDNLETTLELLRTQPEIGRIIEFSEREDPFKVRSFLVDQYRIFYIFDDKTLTVQRILHTKRDITKVDIVDLPEIG